MLPRDYRLKRMKDFKILFKEGRFVSGDLVNLKIWRIDPDKYIKRNYNKDDLKVGFVAGLKIHKSAVKRNRIKRQMREVVRLLLKAERLKKGNMIAIMAKNNIIGKEYKEIEKSILDVLKKARVI